MAAYHSATKFSAAFNKRSAALFKSATKLWFALNSLWEAAHLKTANLKRTRVVATRLAFGEQNFCNTCILQVYQQSFSDAFAALLDLSSGQTHPTVYLYCLEEAMSAGGQLNDVPIPAHHVKMDSSVPWDIIRVDALTASSGIMSPVPLSHLQGPQDQKLHGRSCLESGLKRDERGFFRIKSDMEAQQQPSAADLTLHKDIMTSSIRHIKSPDFDPFRLFNNDVGHFSRFEGELVALQRMLQVTDKTIVPDAHNDDFYNKVSVWGHRSLTLML
jgi:hypothetical protein